MLDIRNINIVFGSTLNPPAVDNMSIKVNQYDKTVIIGETGSGKSVLILALLKMLPSSAIVSGSAIYKNDNILEFNEKQIRKIRGAKISYIPQGSGNGMNPLLRVGFQISEALMEHKKVKYKDALSESISLLKKFDLGDEKKIIGSYPYMLSGGMKQRILITMGIVADAEVIFADEPTKGLDQRRIDMVIDSFKQLQNKTILCVTHDLRFAKEIATNISVMYSAQQIEFARKDEFFNEPLHPYSKSLIEALPENGLNSNLGFAPPKGSYILDESCKFIDRCLYKTNRCLKSPPMIDLGMRKVRCWKYAN